VLIENEFTVADEPARVWEYLHDVELIAPCMPGAEISEQVDDRNWKGRMNVKFGPVALTFSGQVTVQERDDGAHRVVLAAKGMEQKGKGAATATVTSWLEPDGAGTRVKLEADITLTGTIAQLSRGLLPEVSKKLTSQFAECLHESIVARRTGAEAASEAAEAPSLERPAAAKPVGGIGLGFSAIWSLIVGFFKRLFGGGRSKS
jgi:carbon monoxide dehydrogenase subunit G